MLNADQQKIASRTVLFAALGMMASLVSGDILALMSWRDMFYPAFVGGVLAHFGAVAGAYAAGKLTP